MQNLASHLVKASLYIFIDFEKITWGEVTKSFESVLIIRGILFNYFKSVLFWGQSFFLESASPGDQYITNEHFVEYHPRLF